MLNLSRSVSCGGDNLTTKYPCIFHADRIEWVKVVREFQNGERVEGGVCYECYSAILKRDKEENRNG